MSDLVCLVADKDMEAALAALLQRPEAFKIRRISFEIIVHPKRDPGVFREGVDFLRGFQKRFHHGLLLLDARWDGAPTDPQQQLDRALEAASLESWARAVVLAPEPEVWVWSDSPHVAEVLGWSGRTPDLRSWLAQNGLWVAGTPKPQDPKRAMERALWEVRKPRSSALYRALAGIVSVKRCRDPAFLRLRDALQTWFGERT
ncbi:MAG: hypothetical protein WHT82_03255 [Limisphaera sp.]